MQPGTMGGPLLNRQDVIEYAQSHTYRDHPVMPRTRELLAAAIINAEASIMLVEEARSSFPRLFATCLTDEDQPLRAISLIAEPRAPARHRRRRRFARMVRRAWRYIA